MHMTDDKFLPDWNGRAVIHVDKSDYRVGPSFTEGMREILTKCYYETGVVVIYTYENALCYPTTTHKE